MKWPLSKKMETSLLTCVIHKSEQITMYCADHSQLCCSKCFELNHSRPVCCESHRRQAVHHHQLLAAQPLAQQASHPGQGWHTPGYILRPSTRVPRGSTCDPCRPGAGLWILFRHCNTGGQGGKE
ncbi:hypothetical protein DPMN_158592 [Dreissena polymorpha]|uniref:B box-type domain-containing protein n=1 Tax=Dreissena polymorpha TaxID=45954 RepID=A0A9D4INC2_DREPO|nr:hypothetical protein DPMN_158592 [Dreissena polymorpha]